MSVDSVKLGSTSVKLGSTSVKLIALVYNCSSIISRTLESYKGKVDAFHIFIDEKSDVDTKRKVKDFCKMYDYAECEEIKFTTFDDTRNRCLEKAFDGNIRWIMFVDDSYILNGTLDALKHYGCYDVLNVLVKDEHIAYKRPLLFKMHKKYRYTGKIHEKLILESDTCITDISGCFIYDYKDEYSINRSLSRAMYMIQNTDDEHYRSIGYLQLLITGEIDFDAFNKHFKCRCKKCVSILREYFV